MSFQSAIQDYRYLKNRGYPDKAALKLVSDRFRLSGMQRNCLFRAVFAETACRHRKEKLIEASDMKGRSLGIDWYNVLITVESYLKGFPVFISDDGLVRDSSAIHGSYRPGKVTERAIENILPAIGTLKPVRIELFLDSPISFSGDMAERLRTRISETLEISHDVNLSPSADYPLKTFAGVVATSDSSIIDRDSVALVLDLPRYVLERSFEAAIPVIEALEDKPMDS